MPYPFSLSTTSAFNFTSVLECESHPALLHYASSERGILRSALKEHKRLAPPSKKGHASDVVARLLAYLPYLLAIADGLANSSTHSNTTIPPALRTVKVVMKSPFSLQWRPAVMQSPILGREVSRVKIRTVPEEVAFVYLNLGIANLSLARHVLFSVYATSAPSQTLEERSKTFTHASKYFLEAASVFAYLAQYVEEFLSSRPSARVSCVDIMPDTAHALSALALAEATLMAVFKDDPYPAAVSQERNKYNHEWMYKSPDMPKVRAHLFARLCLAASHHASRSRVLLQQASAHEVGCVEERIIEYVDKIHKVSRARACRFFAIDADLGGDTHIGLAWLHAAQTELGSRVLEEDSPEPSSSGSSSSRLGAKFSRLKSEFVEKREDRRVEKELDWGMDAGHWEEVRIVAMLHQKWTKVNDTMNTRAIPPSAPLLAQLPTGREIHTVKPFTPPELDTATLQRISDCHETVTYYDEDSSDDEQATTPQGSAIYY